MLALRENEYEKAKPILKWAGGKTQMLKNILPKIPTSYKRYIEPFVGGGALFFELNPKAGIISDSNPELMNVYQQVALNVNDVIDSLLVYKNTKEMFYEVRAQDWVRLPKAEAAARTIFLNKTCFNGLYRVNKNGQFNVPYGNYSNPKICDIAALRAASNVLQGIEIQCCDYKYILEHYTQPGDLVFLDPPYLPISTYSDFKRYTKEQFYEEDHVELANAVMLLHENGCHIILANSNHPLVHKLYSPFNSEVFQTKRYISCSGDRRIGEDLLITIPPKKFMQLKLVPEPLNAQLAAYPPTRFMGSKSKLLPQIWAIASQFKFNSAVDLFAGSGIVGYMFKTQGKAVISNDYMAMSATFTKAMIENNAITLPREEAIALLQPTTTSDHFVASTFKGLYFNDADNNLIDTLRTNIASIHDQYKQAIAMAALIRTCIKKRPRGIFTYVGDRYNDGRKDLIKSFEQHFLEAIDIINCAVFDNGCNNRSRLGDAMDLRVDSSDLVYIDPPYYSPLSDNEYVRRYHFVEGLARDWKGIEIQQHTLTKKFKSYPTPFATQKGAVNAFDLLFKKYSKSILIVSYSSNSLPTQDDMLAILAKHKDYVEVIPVDYKYSFGNQNNAELNRNKVQEYLFVGY